MNNKSIIISYYNPFISSLCGGLHANIIKKEATLTTLLNTREKTREAATKLFESGVKPTIALIREELDGKGGQKVIQETLADWWVETSNKMLHYQNREKIPKELFEIIDSMWDQAINNAKTSHIQEVEQFQLEIITLKDKLTEMEKAHDDAMEFHEIAAQHLLDDAEHKNNRLTDELDGVNSELKNTNEFSEMVQQQVGEIEQSYKEVESDNKNIQIRLAKAGYEVDAVEKENQDLKIKHGLVIEGLKSQIDVKSEQNDSLKKQLKEALQLVKEKDQAILTLNNLSERQKTTIEKGVFSLHQVEISMEKEKGLLSESNKESALLRKELAGAQLAIKELKKETNKADPALSELVKKISEMEGAIKSLK